VSRKLKSHWLRTAFNLSLSVLISGCASWTEIQKLARGEPSADESRSPASSTGTAANPGSILIEDRSYDPAREKENPSGPDLSKTEFGAQGNWLRNGPDNNNKSGFDPWFGTGPENEGSLWRPDTQDNFYFSRNTKFKVGDVILVKVESAVNDSLNSRIASIIGRNSVRQVVTDETSKAIGDKVAGEVKKATGNDNIAKAVGADTKQRASAAMDKGERYVSVDEIPVRLTEYISGGRFKVDGSSRVLIKGAPYQVHLKGILREEDVQGNGTIASNQVLESKLELTK
jgi:flagellar basal body L-ring protein FlgH